MSGFPNAFRAEMLKMKRSPALRVAWLLPLLFLLVVLLVFEGPLFRMTVSSAGFSTTYPVAHLKITATLWAGLFHPLALGLLAGLIFRPEHRFRMWRHLSAQPLPGRTVFLAKAVLVLGMTAAMLFQVWLGMGVIRASAGALNPILHAPLRLGELGRMLAWLWLGSLPVLALYLWVSDRVSSVAVPVVFGLVGLLLTVAFSAQEHPKPWRRDMIPWVTPYFSAQSVLAEVLGHEDTHLGAKVFKDEPNVMRLPSGRRVKTWQNVPDEVLFPPPPPTPRWFLGAYSLAMGALLLGWGAWDAGRKRV